MATRYKSEALLRRTSSFFLAFLLLLLINSPIAYAVGSEASGSLKYYIGNDRINTGKDNGYSGNKEIDDKDSHYGWKLGQFCVSGHTRVAEDINQNPVFIKTLGDKVALSFELEQDIAALNGNDKRIINEDKDGYDKYFEVNKTNFGRGTLIIRHTDWQNNVSDPIIYTDFLSAEAEINANTHVELFEEGDYEVALNYEIKDDNFLFFDSYSNYRIFFKFSVRNGNCMVYPFDVKTKGELTNSSMTRNGFYLDLAKSRYLDIDIKKEILAQGADGLTTDTRFNRPARDGDEYIEDGIYTLTVSNRYTGEKTTKKIYVGSNDVLRAHVTTGLPISEINTQLSHGAQIKNDGTIVFPPSNIEITITDVKTYEPLAGAVFTVQTAGGVSIGGEYTSGVDGKAIIPSLEQGSYIVSVVKAPENYSMSEKERPVQVTSDKVAALSFTANEFPSLNICNVDSETGEYIADARFLVKDDTDAIVAEVKTLSTGVVTLEHVRPGVYAVTGTHDAAGNELGDDAKFNIEVREDGTVYYNGAVLPENTLIFQSFSAASSDKPETTAQSDASSPSEVPNSNESVEGDTNSSVGIWLAVIVAVIVLAVAAFILVRRRTMKASGSDKAPFDNLETEDDDK